MSMSARVIAIGPFSKCIANNLDYGASSYDDVEEGAVVVSTVFYCETSSTSRELAAAFGVRAFDLGKHHLDPSWVDMYHLEHVAGEYSSGVREGIENFLALRDAGFQFYYMPHG